MVYHNAVNGLSFLFLPTDLAKDPLLVIRRGDESGKSPSENVHESERNVHDIAWYYCQLFNTTHKMKENENLLTC
jgi:hypothetical protein